MMSPRILRDTLAGKSVVVFRTPDAVDDDVDAVGRLVGEAGGTVSGTIAPDPAVRRRQRRREAAVGGQLADRARGPPAEHRAGRPGLAGRRPARHHLAARQEPRRARASTTRSVTRCSPRCATPASSRTAPDGSALADAALIVTGGALGDGAGNQGATVARFAAGLAPHGAGTVVAGRDGSASGTAAIAVTRSDAGAHRGREHRRRRRQPVRPHHLRAGAERADQRRPARPVRNRARARRR